jgi:hypothetical protein
MLKILIINDNNCNYCKFIDSVVNACNGYNNVCDLKLFNIYIFLS